MHVTLLYLGSLIQFGVEVLLTPDDERLSPVTVFTSSWTRLGGALVGAIALGIGLVGFGPTKAGHAQPPGTPPPNELMRDGIQGVRPEAFLFLDETGTQVVMPGMTFEELERLQRRGGGETRFDERASVIGCQIDGSVRGLRAELRVQLDIRIASPIDRLSRLEIDDPIVVDLAMGGMNLLRPASIEGAEGAFVQPSRNSEARSDFIGPETSKRPESIPTTVEPDGQSSGMGTDRSSTSSAYQLVIPDPSALSTTTFTVTMECSVKVRQSDQRTYWLDLAMPTAPLQANISIETDSSIVRSSRSQKWPAKSEYEDDVVDVRVLGDGPEVVSRVVGSQAPTYRIECGGGPIVMNWRQVPKTSPSAALLQVQSVASVRWDSPSDYPIIDVAMDIENVRGALENLRVRLPGGAALLSEPIIGVPETSSVLTETTVGPPVSETPDSTWRLIGDSAGLAQLAESPEDPAQQPSNTQGGNTNEREASVLRLRRVSNVPPGQLFSSTNAGQSRVRLQLRLQMPVPDATPTDPWEFQLPTVLGAVAGSGSLTVTTSENHRLRWRPEVGIQAVTSEVDETTLSRTQAFQFNRPTFGLPIWLATKTRQTRLDVVAELRVAADVEDVTMLVRGQSDGVESRDLRLALGSWQIRRVSSVDSNESAVITVEEGVARWEFESADAIGPPAALEIVAANVLETDSVDDLPAESNAAPKTIRLPQLTSNDPAIIVNDLLVRVRNDAGHNWVVDLANSNRLQRVEPQSELDLTSDVPTGDRNDAILKSRAPSQFRLLSTEGPWEVSGSLVPRPVEVSLIGATDVAIETTQWVSKSTWALTCSVDLQGQLDFSFATSAPGPAPATQQQVPGGDLRWLAKVNGVAATVEPVESVDVPTVKWRLISPELQSGQHQIELSCAATIPASAELQDGLYQSSAESLTLQTAIPRPIVDQIQLVEPYQFRLPSSFVDQQGRYWESSLADPRVLRRLTSPDKAGNEAATEPGIGVTGRQLTDADAQQWLLTSVPTFPIDVALSRTTSTEELVSMPRALLRSVVSDQTRHEQLVAIVRNGQQIRIGLSPKLGQVGLEATLDGQPLEVTRDRRGLRLDVPDGSVADRQSQHLLDVRIWAGIPSSTWWHTVKPMMRLPMRSGWIYWEVVVPSDSHLVWASSSAGRAMRWRREPLRMLREPLMNGDDLLDWVVRSLNENELRLNRPARTDDLSARPLVEPTRSVAAMLPANAAMSISGNRYLFYAGDTFAFEIKAVSRTLLWLIIGAVVVLLVSGFHLVPRLRSPAIAVVLAAALTGLLVIAPDGVVLIGQLVLLALIWVAVFYAVATLIGPEKSDRVLVPSSEYVAAPADRSAGSSMRQINASQDGESEREFLDVPTKTAASDPIVSVPMQPASTQTVASPSPVEESGRTRLDPTAISSGKLDDGPASRVSS
ncbi:MAG: hypothetical protein AAGJ40_04215 [Planctomycetota bacterium]